MYREKLFEDLYNKVPENAKIIIFGACQAGNKILDDLKQYKPNAEVIGFIDNYTSGGGSQNPLPVLSMKEFLNSDIDYDLIIMATRTNDIDLFNVFDLYDMPVIPMTKFVNDYYRGLRNYYNKDNFDKIISMIDNIEQRDLFELIFKVRKNVLDTEVLKDYFFRNKANKYNTIFEIKKHYMENINKDVIKTVVDLGLFHGLNEISFNKQLPNLEKIYAFEAIYDVVRIPWIEDIITNDKLIIVPYAAGDTCKKVSFLIDKNNLGGSFTDDLYIETRKHLQNKEERFEIREVEVMTLDKYCSVNNVIPDFIKMDIEGAELSALKGGKEIIERCRPQLAISIYHSDEDFIYIPLYLKETLKNYKFSIGHYSPTLLETLIYAVPEEIAL